MPPDCEGPRRASPDSSRAAGATGTDGKLPSRPFTCIEGADNPPEPLTPAECDLRDFPFMPLDVRRLRDSAVAALEDAEAFRANVISWCVAWHQTPAGSLPDDDRELARLLGYGRDVQTWRRVRAAGGLHGWKLCSDGQLYHPVVAEKANEAWKRKLFQRERGRRGNAIRWGSKKDQAPIAEASLKDRGSILEGSRKDSFNDRKGQGQGQGQGQYSGDVAESVSAGSGATTPTPKHRGKPTDNLASSGFDTFYREYPRKVGRRDAEKAYEAALHRASPGAILTGLRRHKFSTDPKFIPYPSTWLNGDRWADQGPPPADPNVSRVAGAL